MEVQTNSEIITLTIASEIVAKNLIYRLEKQYKIRGYMKIFLLYLLLLKTALWFKSRHLSNIQNGRHKQSGQHTLACQKKIQNKKLFSKAFGILHFLSVSYGASNFCYFFIQLKVHKNENFFGFDFEFCTISVLVMSKY